MDERKALIGEIARAARTHLEYLSELGVEATEELVWPVTKPQLAAEPSSARPAESFNRPGGIASSNTPVTPRARVSEPPAARLADLPRLGAPAGNPRSRPTTPTTPTRMDNSKPSGSKPILAALFNDGTDAPPLATGGETLSDIRDAIGDCTRCPLHEGRTQIVHTEGTSAARLMFVGEAPGADEDAQGRPFVGRAGQLLNKIIEAIGFRRDEVMIGNINRCRPPQNRAPLPNEVAACKPFIMRDIAAVKPEVVVVLGNTAMKNLLGTKEGITKMRGVFQDYHGIKVMPTFHPAYLLRDPSKKRETWEDLKKVRDYLMQNRPAE
jgi:DNA polymerase